MTKKILAGVLSAATLLSLSATAFATSSDPNANSISGTASADDLSYKVDTQITYGTVDCVVPSKTMWTSNPVVVNPYGAAVITNLGSKGSPDKVKNTSFVASGVYTVTNNDGENGLKVLATVTVNKAIGLVIVDGKADAPVGWDIAEDKGGTKIDRDKELDASGAKITAYNPLVSYDKITLTYKSGADKTPENVEKAVGGAMSAKQAMNTAISLVGGTDKTEVSTNTGANLKKVDFAAKGATTGTLLTLDSTSKASGKKVGYYTVHGELNPCIDREQYAWNKETLSLSIVLKLIPTVEE